VRKNYFYVLSYLENTFRGGMLSSS